MVNCRCGRSLNHPRFDRGDACWPENQPATPVTLRDQIHDIARRRFGDAFADNVSFPMQITAMSANAFGEDWAPGPDTRALRRAWQLLNLPPSCVSDEEPGVE